MKGIPQLKAAADNELYELEKHNIQIDISNNTDENTSNDTDDNASKDNTDITHLNAEECTSIDTVSHVHKQVNGETLHPENNHTNLHKIVYGLRYVPFKEEGQKILLPQTTDMSHKDNLKQLYNSQPKGMCDNEYDSLEQGTFDTETFSFSHEHSTKHVLVKGVYTGSASPLIADIKTEPYSVITYTDDGMLTGMYDRLGALRVGNYLDPIVISQ